MNILRVGQTPPSTSIPEHFRFLSNQPTFLKVNLFYCNRWALWFAGVTTLPCGVRVLIAEHDFRGFATHWAWGQTSGIDEPRLPMPKPCGIFLAQGWNPWPLRGRPVLSHSHHQEAQTHHLEGFPLWKSVIHFPVSSEKMQSWLSTCPQLLRAGYGFHARRQGPGPSRVQGQTKAVWCGAWKVTSLQRKRALGSSVDVKGSCP